MLRSWLYDERRRAILLQLLLVAAILALGYELVSNALASLERNKVASGFGFLNETAGFAINQSLIAYSESDSYGRAFLVGLLNTLVVAVIGIVLASLLGFVIGVARLSKNPLIAWLAAAYIEIFRNLPLLLQLFFWYFAVLRALPPARDSLAVGGGIFLNNRGLYLPAIEMQPAAWGLAALLLVVVGAVGWWWRRQCSGGSVRQGWRWPQLLLLVGGLALLVGIASGLIGPLVAVELPQQGRFNLSGGVRIIPEFVALLLALVIYTAAFIAEIVRAGIKAVDRGQREAGRALGLSGAQVLRHIVLPQALRVIIPPLTSQYLNLTKNSSLAVAIAYPDLVSVFAGIVLNQTGQAVEVLAITMAVYLSLSLATSAFMNWFNGRMALPGR